MVDMRRGCADGLEKSSQETETVIAEVKNR